MQYRQWRRANFQVFIPAVIMNYLKLYSEHGILYLFIFFQCFPTKQQKTNKTKQNQKKEKKIISSKSGLHSWILELAGNISLLLLPFPHPYKVKVAISHSSSEEQFWSGLSYLCKKLFPPLWLMLQCKHSIFRSTTFVSHKWVEQ